MLVDRNVFFDKICKATTIAIFGHIRPDGDCVGSCLGLYNYLSENIPDKSVALYLQEMPDSFRFLKNSEVIKTEPENIVYDLGISLDCGDTDRHGKFGFIYAQARDSICIDHHRSNQGFGDYYYCDADASSTSELVYRFLDYDKISKECAECLYLGIIHDTGVFKYSSTSENTMICAGKLMSKGIDTQSIIDETFYRMTYKQNRLKAQAVLNSSLYLDGRLIATCIDQNMFDEFDATRKDTDGIVDQIRLTEGIEVAVFAYQLSEDKFKYSLRSINQVDVSRISVGFGGGGHIRAAGFELEGSYEDNLEKIIALVAEQLQ